jgi:hypothetical protein
MFLVTLKETDVRNLAAFLERITLKGSEVEAFNAVIAALNSAKKVATPVAEAPEATEQAEVPTT